MLRDLSLTRTTTALTLKQPQVAHPADKHAVLTACAAGYEAMAAGHASPFTPVTHTPRNCDHTGTSDVDKQCWCHNVVDAAVRAEPQWSDKRAMEDELCQSLHS